LNKWENDLPQIANIHAVSHVKQTEIRPTEPLIPESNPSDVEIIIEKLKRFKSLSTNQILTKIIEGGRETLCSGIPKFISSIWSNRELSLLSSRRAIKLIVVILHIYFSCQFHTGLYPTLFSQDFCRGVVGHD
jgi:hypothetical protein